MSDHDETLPEHRSDNPRRRPSKALGRRKSDTDPRVTFTKKFLVIVVAMVNAVYLASELFLSAVHACN